jgi:hypothetical protein
VTYGTYGALREKGYGPWGAGAATGAIGGVIAGGLAWIGASIMPGMLESMKLTNTSNYSGLAGSVFQSDWAGVTMQPSIAGIVAQQLSGLSVQQIKGLDVQLGGYAVDPVSGQLIG